MLHLGTELFVKRSIYELRYCIDLTIKWGELFEMNEKGTSKSL